MRYNLDIIAFGSRPRTIVTLTNSSYDIEDDNDNLFYYVDMKELGEVQVTQMFYRMLLELYRISALLEEQKIFEVG